MSDEYIIYSYSRKQAIEDGVLIDVSERAKQFGVKYPLAITDTLWTRFITNPYYQVNEAGKLSDVLMMFVWAARKIAGNEVHFKVLFATETGHNEEVGLWAFIGIGDTPEPV